MNQITGLVQNNLISAKIKISDMNESKWIDSNAIFDTGATHFAFPKYMLNILDLKPVGFDNIYYANQSRKKEPVYMLKIKILNAVVNIQGTCLEQGDQCFVGNQVFKKLSAIFNINYESEQWNLNFK